MVKFYQDKMKANALELNTMFCDSNRARGGLQLFVTMSVTLSVLVWAWGINQWYGWSIWVLDAIVMGTMAYYIGKVRHTNHDRY